MSCTHIPLPCTNMEHASRQSNESPDHLALQSPLSVNWNTAETLNLLLLNIKRASSTMRVRGSIDQNQGQERKKERKGRRNTQDKPYEDIALCLVTTTPISIALFHSKRRSYYHWLCKIDTHMKLPSTRLFACAGVSFIPLLHWQAPDTSCHASLARRWNSVTYFRAVQPSIPQNVGMQIKIENVTIHSASDFDFPFRDSVTLPGIYAANCTLSTKAGFTPRPCNNSMLRLICSFLHLLANDASFAIFVKNMSFQFEVI